MPPIAGRGVFHRHQRTPAPLTTRRNALEEPHHHEQERREHPDLLMRRQQPDPDGRRTHQ